MLVDLARNDLSRNGHEVQVEKYREVQFFSHVIHLVSKVTGKLNENHTFTSSCDTFPAGTLSGAPKQKPCNSLKVSKKPIEISTVVLSEFMDFEGNFNHAIMIRTFLSKNHQLHFQAGAGIVESSDEESEMQEVYNKLGALKKLWI
jgi:anthranilate synthase component 1